MRASFISAAPLPKPTADDADYNGPDEQTGNEVLSVVLPLRIPAQFGTDVRDPSLGQILQHSFHDPDAIREHQGQPMRVAGLAVPEREASQRSAQATWGSRGSKRRRDVRPLVGMKHFGVARLLRRTFPSITRMLTAHPPFHRICRIV